MTQNRLPEPLALVTPANTPFTYTDLFNVVHEFYGRVQEDELLKVPFASVHDWPEHVERLTHFWWIKFGGEPYMMTYYNPVLKHYYAGFNETFLERWIQLFSEVAEKNLNEAQASLWMKIVKQMGYALTMKNEAYKAHVEQNK